MNKPIRNGFFVDNNIKLFMTSKFATYVSLDSWFIIVHTGFILETFIIVCDLKKTKPVDSPMENKRDRPHEMVLVVKKAFDFFAERIEAWLVG